MVAASTPFDDALARGRTAWPSLDLDGARFVAHLRERVGSSDLTALHAEDLYLAYGCAIGDARALAAFDSTHGETIASIARRHRRDARAADDLGQILLEHFLSPREGGRPPRIAEYRGLGPLEGWLRVAGARRLVDDHRRSARTGAEEPRENELLDRLSSAGQGDWELEFLKAKYAEAFRRAFAAAATRLTSEQRNFLRYQCVEGLTLDQIAALHAMHRSSVDRRIEGARRALLRDTRAALAVELASEPDEVESIMRLIQSRLDVSLSRLLRSS